MRYHPCAIVVNSKPIAHNGSRPKREPASDARRNHEVEHDQARERQRKRDADADHFTEPISEARQSECVTEVAAELRNGFGGDPDRADDRDDADAQNEPNVQQLAADERTTVRGRPDRLEREPDRADDAARAPDQRPEGDDARDR